LEKYFPSLKNSFVLCNEKINYANCIVYDDSKTHGNQMITALEQISTDYVIYAQEDYILFDYVNETEIEKLIGYMESDKEIPFIRLIQSGLGNSPSNQISFVGKLPNEEALELLSKSSVLLSTAPFESFGMALLEGAKMGIPIVSKPTSGALDLREGYDSLSLGNTPKELAELALIALNRETPGVISDSLFLKSENEAVDAIVDAWIKLL
jgi:glycosyltransferase involved in cell wall biosynthesis